MVANKTEETILIVPVHPCFSNLQFVYDGKPMYDSLSLLDNIAQFICYEKRGLIGRKSVFYSVESAFALKH